MLFRSQHPIQSEPQVVDADGTKKDVGHVTQQAQDKFEELKYQAGQTAAEANNKAQNYADTDSPQKTEENKMGMKEKMRQMGVSLTNVRYPRIYLYWAL